MGSCHNTSVLVDLVNFTAPYPNTGQILFTHKPCFLMLRRSHNKLNNYVFYMLTSSNLVTHNATVYTVQ